MRSFIAAVAILAAILIFAGAHSAATARFAGDMADRIGVLTDSPETDKCRELADDWLGFEPVMRMTVNEDRLRAVRSALIEFLDEAERGDASRSGKLLAEAMENAFAHERVRLGQIF